MSSSFKKCIKNHWHSPFNRSILVETVFWVMWTKIDCSKYTNNFLIENLMKRRKNNSLEEKLRESFAVISYKYVKYICHCGLGDLIIRYVLHKLVKIVNFALVFLINLKYIVFAEAFPLPKFSCRVLF